METPREREIAAEDSIKVVCRFRPLNDSEEKAGSKFIVKFPSGGEENCISIGVCSYFLELTLLSFSSIPAKSLINVTFITLMSRYYDRQLFLNCFIFFFLYNSLEIANRSRLNCRWTSFSSFKRLQPVHFTFSLSIVRVKDNLLI